MDNVTQRVNEYAVLTQQMARLKSRAEELKAYFERLAVADLKDTKLKTVEYLGSDGGRVTVSMTEAPKLGSSHMLRGLPIIRESERGRTGQDQGRQQQTKVLCSHGITPCESGTARCGQLCPTFPA